VLLGRYALTFYPVAIWSSIWAYWRKQWRKC